jgi:uncharacterized protein with ParB-like and HNH nuclease domain
MPRILISPGKYKTGILIDCIMPTDRISQFNTAREIKTLDINLLDFIRMLAEGKFLVPTFQRYFVWEPENIIALWDSIYHFYPIGSIMYWKTDIRLKIHRKLGGFVLPREKKTTEDIERSYILDGQQRATSLLASFYGGQGRINRSDSFDYTMYFDATRAEFFFENELYKRKWKVDPAFLIKLKDAAGLNIDHVNKISNTSGFDSNVKTSLLNLRHMFISYKISLICITGFDIASVCKIFERVNNGGRSLENLDILVARSFKDNPIIVEEV